MMRFLLAALVTLWATGCGDGDDQRPNVILVIGDTFRADKLSCQGGPDGITPYLDRIAAEGVRFSEVRSHAPWTLPSTASLLTSLHPDEHGAGGRVGQFTRMGADVRTVVSQFREQGYSTHAIVNVAFLDPAGFGVTSDFESVDKVIHETNVDVRAAEATTRAALDWIDGQSGDEPFFLLVHYFDPHCVYAPPKPFRERWAEPADRASDWTFGTRAEMVAIRNGKLSPAESVLRRAEALYNGEVHYLDAEIGRLDDGLAQRGLKGDSVFVFTADHGEEFLEHAGFEHGHTLYDELLRVPLVIRAPGALKPAVIDAAVRHIDVAPTLCELCNVPISPAFVGRSLVDLAGGQDPVPRAALAHGNFWSTPQTCWTKGGWKLIQRAGRDPELYHLDSDPGETRDMFTSEPERAAALLAELDGVLAGMKALASGGSAADLDPAVQDVLKGLGYGK